MNTWNLLVQENICYKLSAKPNKLKTVSQKEVLVQESQTIKQSGPLKRPFRYLLRTTTIPLNLATILKTWDKNIKIQMISRWFLEIILPINLKKMKVLFKLNNVSKCDVARVHPEIAMKNHKWPPKILENGKKNKKEKEELEEFYGKIS